MYRNEKESDHWFRRYDDNAETQFADQFQRHSFPRFAFCSFVSSRRFYRTAIAWTACAEINAAADLRGPISIPIREIDARRLVATSHVNIVNLVGYDLRTPTRRRLINRRTVINGRPGSRWYKIRFYSRNFIFISVDLHGRLGWGNGLKNGKGRVLSHCHVNIHREGWLKFHFSSSNLFDGILGTVYRSLSIAPSDDGTICLTAWQRELRELTHREDTYWYIGKNRRGVDFFFFR